MPLSKLSCVWDDLLVYVNTNWRNGLSLKGIGAHFQIDPSDAEHLFRRMTGTTIKRYVDELRKENLLEFIVSKKDLYGYEISCTLGFQNEQTFYRWVKRTYGKTFTNLRDEPWELGNSSHQAQPQEYSRTRHIMRRSSNAN